jgi:hypothetical protein
MRRFLQRNLTAALVFAVAALWLGLGLVSAFECLLMFGLASTLVGVIQRRQGLAKPAKARASNKKRSRSAHSRRSAQSPRLGDGGAETADWPHLAETNW